MLSARQLGIARVRFINSGLRNNVSTNHCLLSVAAGQPSDSIAMVCSNESTLLAKSTIAYCMLNIGFHWQMAQPQSPTCHRC